MRITFKSIMSHIKRIPGKTYTPIFVIGAPRSGTNLLRDLLCANPQCLTWPCDEINGVWRYGNLNLKDDEFDKSAANSVVKSFIRKNFAKFWRKKAQAQHCYLVEKTCANSLRLEFVKEIFPDAKFIILFRNAPEVLHSAEKRWKGYFEYNLTEYLLRKVKYTPSKVLFVLTLNFLKIRIARLFSSQRALSIWGPTICEFDSNIPRIDKIALQWCKCVERTLDSLHDIPKENYMIVHYDEVIRQPHDIVASMLAFLGDELLDEANLSRIKILNKSQHSSLPTGLSVETINKVKCCQKRIDEIFFQSP